jgi:cyclopropane fatty-acyl-phospholipid synthase-like methyltransferase
MTIDELLAEEHHRFYGRPWILGKFAFEYLLRRGLAPTDQVLDFGCGSGRLGIWLIPYLDAGRYFGVDWHLRSLVAFSEYEAVFYGLAAKQPRLMLSGDFEFEGFGVDFDVMLDFYVSPHLSEERAAQAYARARETIRPKGRVFMPHAPSLGEKRMSALGFELTHTERVGIPTFHESAAADSGPDHWHEFTPI